MEEELGMLNVSSKVEAQGRGEDTEVGFIEIGSIVIPEPIATDPNIVELLDSLKSAIEMQGQNPEQFTVTPENTLYAYSQDNAIPAHLTNGEFVIPVQVVNVVPNLQAQLAELYSLGEVNLNQYIVGNEANSINPTTGYPEFFFKKAWKAVTGAVKSVGKAIKKGVDGVVDFTSNFVKSLGQGVSDLFKGDIDAVLKNPAVIATASFFAPQYAAYINLGSKAATGQKITASDLVSAGFSATTDFTKVKIDPNAVKAVNTAAQIADGTDPLQALAGNYGSDFAKDLGLDTRVNQALASTVGEDYANRITSNFDINQAAADYAAGNSTERILANQYGDDIVNYLGAETPTQQAFGFAGIETALQKAEGASDEDALLAGAKTYYDRGGALPDLNTIGSLAGIQDFNLNLNDVVGNLNLDFPDLSLRGYDLPSLANLGIDLNQFNFQAPDILDMNLSLPEIAGLGLDLGNVDFSGFQTSDLGAYNLKELGDLGIDVNSLNLNPEFQMIGLAQLLDPQVPTGVNLRGDEELASLGSPFDLQPTDEPLFSREVLARTPQIS